MKALVSYNDNESKSLEMGGWCPSADEQPTHAFPEDFSTCIPLKFLLGFAEDYQKIIVNVSQELILLRSRTDLNCYRNTLADGTKTASITISKIEWHIPHIAVNDEIRLKLIQTLSVNKPIYLPFRRWELHELPSLRQTKTDIWPVKTSTSLEKPRYVIVGFQRGKREHLHADATDFDHASLANIKLHLNSESYPYDKMHLQMNIKRYTVAYRMYAAFQSSYYPNKSNQPLLDYADFHKKPLFVIDCSKQNDAIKSSTVDIKLEMESDRAFAQETTAYCLILHDNVIEYTPLTGIVKKIL
jgi:hypothetical protein